MHDTHIVDTYMLQNLKIRMANSVQEQNTKSSCYIVDLLLLPLKINSNKVVRFSGLGLVTKILE